MVVVDCPVALCAFQTTDVGEAIAAVVLGHHLAHAHPVGPVPNPVPRATLKEKADKPSLTLQGTQCDENDWEFFKL